MLGEVSFKFPQRLSKSVIPKFLERVNSCIAERPSFFAVQIFGSCACLCSGFNLRQTSVGIIENLILAWSWR
ncbi:MAG: hypothetical protein EB086_13390 [Rhodobacteraceae bacterium]|nr:hypothetical protein [Paracoccaceae bacterium]